MKMSAGAFEFINTVAWLSSNELNNTELVLRRASLIPGWVTVCGQVNHLGM